MNDDTITTADQAEPQSAVDRIAAKFGFPASDRTEAPAEEVSGADDLAELEWDGAKYQVPTKLKDAFMKNEDYTRKTQELSEQRKSLDHIRALAEQRQMDGSFFDSVKAETQQMSVIDAYLAQVGKIDWSSMTSEQMFRQKMELDNIKEQRQALAAQIDAKRGEFNKSVQSKIAEMRKSARDLASKSIQGFSEETEKAIRAFAESEGLASQEVDNVLLDPRSFKIVWKAMQFDKVQAGTQKVDKVQQVIKPGAASERMPATTAAKLNFNKAMKGAATSSQKAQVIEQRLAGLFSKR